MTFQKAAKVYFRSSKVVGRMHNFLILQSMLKLY